MTRVRVPLRSFSTCVETASSSCGGSGTDTFLGLEDTPDSYAGFAGKAVKVKITEDGLEFGDVVAASGLDLVTTNTAGGTITLDMNNQTERMFKGSANIGAIKTWALSNNLVALFIPSVKFTMTSLSAQTFPATFRMATFDANWDNATKKWTPPDVGIYDMSATYDGILSDEWFMKIQGPY